MRQSYIEHYTRDGDRWDYLAFYYYKDVTLQGLLINTNDALFEDKAIPAILPAGLTLKIPLVEKSVSVSNTVLPPWKQQ